MKEFGDITVPFGKIIIAARDEKNVHFVEIDSSEYGSSVFLKAVLEPAIAAVMAQIKKGRL